MRSFIVFSINISSLEKGRSGGGCADEGALQGQIPLPKTLRARRQNAIDEMAIRPFLVIISIAEKKKKIKKTNQVFCPGAYFLHFREIPAVSIVKCDGETDRGWFTFVEERVVPSTLREKRTCNGEAVTRPQNRRQKEHVKSA